MAHHHNTARAQDENELWFGIPSSSRRQSNPRRAPEQSAYRATTNRLSVSSTTSRTPPSKSVPSSNINKPLPPSPSETGRTQRKRASWRDALRREPSSRPETSSLDTNYLRPEPYPQRYSSLSLNTTDGHFHHNYSRSMPTSPYEHPQAANTAYSPQYPRAHSAAADYEDATQYQPYSAALHPQEPARSVRQQRSTSANNYFDSLSPIRARTFPEPTAYGREVASDRQRPRTWLSPTEPFTDVSQFHLFAEAMTGFPHETDPFSPGGPPQLQGSLFARRPGSEADPIPLRYPDVQSTRSLRDDWQNFEPPSSIPTRPHSASRLSPAGSSNQWASTAHMNTINVELEMLGIDDEELPDDELPDYAQSQAEMSARKRAEASARARELEARWRGTRGR